MNAIEVTNLVKKYNKAATNAVDDVSFSVKEGEFFAFLGPNGAGKTTTISILTTTLSKTSGDIKIAGHDIDKESSLVRSRIGVIFQNPSLDQNLTAEENIRLHSILYNMYPFAPTYKMMPDAYKQKVNELAEVLDLQKEIFKPIKTFSGGMKRKLEIIRTLMHKPRVLFLDEPTSGLDPFSRRNLWLYLQKIRKEENITIFLTTHYLDEAEGADHICIINNGKIIEDGTIEGIKSKFLKDYLYMESKDDDSLGKELKNKGYNFEVLNNGFKINLRHNSEEAHDILKSISTKLSKIKVVQPTLEDVYLDLIGGLQHA